MTPSTLNAIWQRKSSIMTLMMMMITMIIIVMVILSDSDNGDDNDNDGLFSDPRRTQEGTTTV